MYCCLYGPYKPDRSVPLETLVSCGSPGGSRGIKGSGRSTKSVGGNGEGSFKGGGRKGKGRATESGKQRGRGGSVRKSTVTAPLESVEEMGEGGDGPSLEKGGSEDDEWDGETFLKKFRLFLQSPLGGNKSNSAACQVERNVLKYLKQLNMNPHRLLDLHPVQPFIQQIHKEGIGCSGILQCLDAHCLALKFLNFSSEEEGLSGKVQRAQDFLRSFRKSFQAQKVSKERESIEAKAYNPLDLSGVDQFLTDVNIRDECFASAEDILGNRDPTKSQYNTCLAIIAGRVLHSNAQRPAAVTGALLSEYADGFKAQKKAERYLTIRVHVHKTGSSESAKLVISRETLKLLTVWEEVRDKVAEQSPYLFPDFKGGQVAHLTRVVTRYAEEKNITLVNPQTFR